jgi:hypothetical protein
MELIERFKLGYANRTLAYRLAPKQFKAGAELRTALQRVGILRESGHEHFNGSIVIPLFGEPGDTSARPVVGAYGRKVNDNLRAKVGGGSRVRVFDCESRWAARWFSAAGGQHVARRARTNRTQFAAGDPEARGLFQASAKPRARLEPTATATSAEPAQPLADGDQHLRGAAVDYSALTLLTRRTMSSANGDYIRDIVYLLRERGAKVTKENRARDSAFNEGREAAFREVLALMQNQADIFGVPRQDICLDGFDALVGPLDPPKPRPIEPSSNAS